MFESNSSFPLCAHQRADEADLPCSGERQQVGARALTECLRSTMSIWAEVSANEILHLARYSEGVECEWGNGHIWREE